jgi:hypothetical protein
MRNPYLAVVKPKDYTLRFTQSHALVKRSLFRTYFKYVPQY